MLNALKYVEDLEKSGFTEQQAKTSINMWLELMNDNLATKNDLRELRLATKSDLNEHRLNTEKEFAAIRHEMKEEFAAIRHEMKEEFAAVRHEMKEEFAVVRHEMKELESRLTIKLGAMMAVGIGVMAYFR